jgi:hypothetical protein
VDASSSNVRTNLIRNNLFVLSAYAYCIMGKHKSITQGSYFYSRIEKNLDKWYLRWRRMTCIVFVPLGSCCLSINGSTTEARRKEPLTAAGEPPTDRLHQREFIGYNGRCGYSTGRRPLLCPLS